MHTISAVSKDQVVVNFDGEVFNRVPVRGSVHLRLLGDGTVELWSKRWEVYIRRSDKFLEDVSHKTRDKAIDAAIALGAEWVKSNSFDILEAEVRQADLHASRTENDMLKAKVAYEQAIGEYERAQAALKNAVYNLEQARSR